MKTSLYIAVLAFLTAACSTTRPLSSTMEDDIYFVPGQKALVVKEVEKLTGQEIDSDTDISSYAREEASQSAGSSIPPASFNRNQSVGNTLTEKSDGANLREIGTQAQNLLDNNEEVNQVLYENTGYWIGGFKGNEYDLDEIQRIIDLYPNGFAYFGNGPDIALNLSFDPDWNVYTDNGRYWWFPSSSNFDLYASLLFGTYPKYIWTVIWDNPRYDSWAFDASFNRGFRWGLNLNWGGPGWNLGLGWNSGWYDPWYNGWYGGWYNGWYDPWYRPWYGYYPGWGYPHWHHPHWGHPHWGHYPNVGGGSVTDRPFRPATRPNFNTNRPTRPSDNGNNRPSGYFPGTSIRPSGSSTTRPGSNNSQLNRPGNPNQGTTTRPNVARPNTVRPSTNRPGSLQRPTSPTNTTTRPSTTTRPNVARPNVTRPGTPTRPNLNRPGQVTRPSTGTVTRPTIKRPTTNVTRPSATTRPPATRYTRPGSSSSYTRPSNSRSNVKTYSRPQSSYRPTYNTKSTSRYNSGSSLPTRSSGSYTPSRSSGGGTSTPARSNTSRPTRR